MFKLLVVGKSKTNSDRSAKKSPQFSPHQFSVSVWNMSCKVRESFRFSHFAHFNHNYRKSILLTFIFKLENQRFIYRSCLSSVYSWNQNFNCFRHNTRFLLSQQTALSCFPPYFSGFHFFWYQKHIWRGIPTHVRKGFVTNFSIYLSIKNLIDFQRM